MVITQTRVVCAHGNWMDQYHWHGGGGVNYAAAWEGENSFAYWNM